VVRKKLTRALVLVASIVIATLAMRRRGYAVGGHTIVRCRSGHLFTTLWIPGASFKSLSLGLMRFQYCPVGKHWTLVSLVKEAELTDEERSIAAEHHDLGIP
jgi:hypothetical protein